VAGKHPPGSCPVYHAHARLGGKVDSAEFKALAEGLMRDGQIVEVWTVGERGAIGHRFVLPGRRSAVRGNPVRARGRADLVRAEYGDLGSD
jgi:hypothetical protein